MAPIIALVAAIAICLALFRREVSKVDVNPLIAVLLGLALIVLAHNGGNTVELGPSLWSSYWLPQMLAIVMIFLLIVVPGPRLAALIKAEKSAGYKALASTVIGILVFVLVGMIAITAASHNFSIPLLLNR
jgi:hypothetical protein